MNIFLLKHEIDYYNRRVKFVRKIWVWAESEKLNEDLLIYKDTLSTLNLKEENKLITTFHRYIISKSVTKCKNE